ncbi:hypothetical protein KTAU_31390 [Thermogemmatispora aurantia]|nr:hypothetical protein KTAU_31390 [Thermogemmatispora aurantia]
MTLQEALAASTEARYEEYRRGGEIITAKVACSGSGYEATLSRWGGDIQLECVARTGSAIALERCLKANGVDPHVGWRPVSAQ